METKEETAIEVAVADAPKDQTTEKKPQKALTPIKMDKDGLVIVETLQDELRVCAALVESKMVPESLDSPQKLFAARQLCREIGLPVMSAIRQVCVINGSPSLWGDTPLAIVRRSGYLEHIREYLIDKDYKEISVENKNLDAEIFAAVCEIKRKDFDKRSYFFTIAQATKANLLTKAIWKLYQSRMLSMKARGLALKNEFSDILMGIAMAEYDFDQIPGSNVRDVADANTSKVNNFFNDGESHNKGDNHDSSNTTSPGNDAKA